MRTHWEGTPGGSEVDDLIKADKVKEDDNSMYRIRRHGRKNRNFLEGLRGKY